MILPLSQVSQVLTKKVIPGDDYKYNNKRFQQNPWICFHLCKCALVLCIIIYVFKDNFNNVNICDFSIICFLFFQTLVCMLNLVISSKIWSGFNFEISLASIKERTYKAFLRPTWEYASLLWDSITQKNIGKIAGVDRHHCFELSDHFHNTSGVGLKLEKLRRPSLQQRL